jgi:hypothetical protein
LHRKNIIREVLPVVGSSVVSSVVESTGGSVVCSVESVGKSVVCSVESVGKSVVCSVEEVEGSDDVVSNVEFVAELVGSIVVIVTFNVVLVV